MNTGKMKPTEKYLQVKQQSTGKKDRRRLKSGVGQLSGALTVL